MGGSTGRPTPRWRPLRIVSANCFAVQRPRPVSPSDVRLAVKLTPQGPAHAVFVAETTISQGPAGSFGTGGMTTVSGWPESMRLASGSGPFAPIFIGVWQSPQPPVVTRYSPRLTAAGDGSAASALEASTTPTSRAVTTG